MFTSTTPYVESLGNNLVLKSVSTEDEIVRLGAFNERIHGEGLDAMTQQLIRNHPLTHPDHWLFIEEETSRKIVSALCLIPWTWQYEDVALKAGEMGIVGTLEEYRNRGLIRALDKRFKTMLKEGGFHLSHIQGIPYFYRLLGYEYALALDGGWHLRLDQVPDELPPNAQGYNFRQATTADIPTLQRLHDDAVSGLAIHSPRSAEIWHYLLTHNPHTEYAAQFWLVMDESNQPVAYFKVLKYGFTNGLNIEEASNLSHAAALAALGKIKAIAKEREKPFIRLYPCEGHTLLRCAQAWGAQDTGRYQWQILIPDEAHLLREIAPVLERRIANSPFAGLDETVTINLFRHAIALTFKAGRITSVENVGFQPWGNGLAIPPNVFVPLALGYRSLKELQAAYPDVSVWGQNQFLVDVLFPKMTSHIYQMY